MSARSAIAILGRRAGLSETESEALAEQLLDAYRAEVLVEVYRAIEDPAQREAVGGGLGWETARDVVHNMIRKVDEEATT